MSKYITQENLLSVFPEVLANDTKLMALAVSTAEELIKSYNNNDLLSLYTRIDELPEDLLDILAYDFKIDWWDENYSLEEKRATFKSHWHVHRTLGTPSAVSTAVSAIYENVKILEWWEYSGNPHRFKLLIDTGGVFVDYEKLERIIERVKFYKNLRSILESVDFTIDKSTKVYVGTALQSGTNLTMKISGVDPDDYSWLTDENGDYLMDENGLVLFDEE